MDDLISRQAAIDAVEESRCLNHHQDGKAACAHEYEHRHFLKILRELPSTNQWIPVSERLPENTEPVNITWVNRKPEPYYADIKDKPFAATGHYCNGRWWWYSAVCQDYLDEYGKCDMDEMDGDIEVVAWQPLPEPYKWGRKEDT